MSEAVKCRPVLLDAQTQKPIAAAEIITPSSCVELAIGGTLSEWEPTSFLTTLEHDLDGYPYPLLVGERDGAAILIPAAVKYPDRWAIEIFTTAGWAGPVELKKRTSHLYDAVLKSGIVHIRLI